MPRGGPAGGRARPRVLRALLAVVAGLAVTSVACAPPVSAHDSRSVVWLAVDGSGGNTTVHALVLYRGDGQPVANEYVLAELTSGGRTRSFQVRPSDRVAGEFASTAHLPDGHWQLVVSAKAATTGAASGEFDVAGGRASGAHLSAAFIPSDAGTTPRSEGPLPWIVAGVLVAAALVGLMVLSSRRSRPATAEPPPGRPIAPMTPDSHPDPDGPTTRS